MPENGPITPTPSRLARSGIGRHQVTRRGLFGRVGRAIGALCLLSIAAEVAVLPDVESAPLPAALPTAGGDLVPADAISFAELDRMISTSRASALALPPLISPASALIP